MITVAIHTLDLQKGVEMACYLIKLPHAAAHNCALEMLALGTCSLARKGSLPWLLILWLCPQSGACDLKLSQEVKGWRMGRNSLYSCPLPGCSPFSYGAKILNPTFATSLLSGI